jgi:uncharacterized protein (DUF1697 family)
MATVPREIVLLRGVNVAGRTLSMAALRDALTDAGCTDVTTYIQSGNVVLTPPKRVPADMRGWFERIVAAVAGSDVPVVLRSRTEIDRTVAKNPYPGAGGKELHVVFFADPPPAGVVAGIDLDVFAPEHCTLVGRDLYLRLPNGMGRAKLPLALEKAGRKAEPPSIGTARNWNTVLKLADLAGN